MNDLTIFVGTYNRLETLERTIESFRRFTTSYEVVIVDNGTDDPKCLHLLDKLASYPEVSEIYPLRGINSMQELTDNYNVAVRDQYNQPGRNDWFAITDADICFEGSSPESLNAYLRLAEKTGHAVGPHHRIDQKIPMGYPLRPRVLSTESRLLYKSEMNWLDEIPYTLQPIDTTFHLFPATDRFKRLGMDTYRVGKPYDAMHLDWYVDALNPTEENWIYINKRSSVGSWGRNWIADFWLLLQEDPEKAFEFIFAVPRNLNDDLCITSFIISWCLQMGVGVAQNEREAIRWLHAAIPVRYEIFWRHEKDWMEMIYRNDFSSLGWDD